MVSDIIPAITTGQARDMHIPGRITPQTNCLVIRPGICVDRAWLLKKSGIMSETNVFVWQSIWRKGFQALSYNREFQYRLKQVSVGFKMQFAVLQFGHAFGDGEPETVAFGIAG